jgi:N utilization substance protein B
VTDRPPAGGRRQSREEALKGLYRMQVTGDTAATVADDIRKNPAVGEDAASYAVHLLTLFDVNRDDIDAQLAGWLDKWEPGRLAQTDRAVLRLAVTELLFAPETPVKVVLDEAIELAKRYGSVESGRFVNGVLDRAARAVRGL